MASSSLINFAKTLDEPQIDYQIELTREERVNIYDKDGNSLGTTILDSIPYWIEKDNL